MPPKRQYSSDAFQNALSAVRQNRLNISRASFEYGVPKSTLHSHVKGIHNSYQSGPGRQLTAEEENSIVNYIIYMARHGLPMTRSMIRCYVIEIVKRSGRSSIFNFEKGPSDEWFRNFYKGHPELSERKAENMDRSRTRMSNPKVAADYFTLLEKVLTENGLKDKPSQIYNCDETGLSGKEAVRTKVAGPKTGHLFSQKFTTTDHITRHLCICADGTVLPTMVIFKGSLPHRNFDDGLPDSWLFSCSESGYMDGDLFYRWFEKIFLQHCSKQRPVLLIMDNHDSHISLKVMEKALENNVVLMGLPAHTTHFLQPLDVKVIGPLKSRFSSIANNLGFISQRLTIGKSKFPVVLKYSLDQATPASIQNAFVETGIYPFNADAIDRTQLVPSTFSHVTQNNENDRQPSNTTTCETCGLFLVNPLVSQGLVPQRLASILVPPPTQPLVQKKSRVVPSARVLTGEEMLMQLKEREEQAEKKKQETEKRKRDRELRREEKQKEEEERKLKKLKKDEEKQKEEEERKLKKLKKDEEKQRKNEEKTLKQETKRRQKEAKAREKDLLAASVAASLYVCSVCDVHGRVDDELNGIFWYGCDEDMCMRWYHEGCLSDKEMVDLELSLDEGENWYCRICKPWIYEE